MKSKKCSTCHKQRKIKFFQKDKRHGYTSQCVDCKRKSSLTWYRKNKQKVAVYQNSKKEELRKRIAIIKNRPCADCHKRFPPYCMDFDHVKGKKKFTIGNVNSAKWKKILKEIEKCDVVCTICHRIRTYRRQHDKNS